MLRFTTKDGTDLVAYTHRFMSEAVIIKNPYSYSYANGGGTIVQRFGAPSEGQVDGAYHYHSFGIPPGSPFPSPWVGGVHNVWHSPSSRSASMRGMESISMFINSATGSKTSMAVEFALNLTEQKPGVTYDDSVFATTSVFAHCGFLAVAQGGARAIADGVFIAASGVSPAYGSQLQVIDSKGGVKAVKWPGEGIVPLYDPFIRVEFM